MNNEVIRGIAITCIEAGTVGLAGTRDTMQFKDHGEAGHEI